MQYDIYITTSATRHSGTEDTATIRITGSEGETESMYVGDTHDGTTKHLVKYAKDVGEPECVRLWQSSTDGWDVTRVSFKKEGDANYYTTGGCLAPSQSYYHVLNLLLRKVIITCLNY